MSLLGLHRLCGLVLIALAAVGNAVAIRGIPGINPHTGERPFRQEFSTFKDSGPAFDLYILSLLRFQETDQQYQLSYFQVAGRISKSFRPSRALTLV